MVYAQNVHSTLNVTYKVNKRVEMQGRAELVYFPGKAVIGSGQDIIDWNKKSLFTAQLIYTW